MQFWICVFVIETLELELKLCFWQLHGTTLLSLHYDAKGAFWHLHRPIWFLTEVLHKPIQPQKSAGCIHWHFTDIITYMTDETVILRFKRCSTNNVMCYSAVPAILYIKSCIMGCVCVHI